MTKQPRPPPAPQATLEEDAARAIGSQGFLLVHHLEEELHLRFSVPGARGDWTIEGVEVPVTTTLGEETRTDLVLGRRGDPLDLRAIIECKRANPAYKRWFFFGGGKLVEHDNPLHFEGVSGVAGSAIGGPAPSDQVVRHCSPSTTFHPLPYGVELRDDRNPSNPPSSTTAIENGLRQLLKGVNGYLLRHSRIGTLSLRAIPILVTTAELLTVKYDPSNIQPASATLTADHLTVAPVEWLAVNVPTDNGLSHNMLLTRGSPTYAAPESYHHRDLRTVFIVRSPAAANFLQELGTGGIVPFNGW